MAGYMAGRGDFMQEHDNFMELDLRSLEFSTDDIDETETGSINSLLLTYDTYISIFHGFQLWI